MKVKGKQSTEPWFSDGYIFWRVNKREKNIMRSSDNEERVAACVGVNLKNFFSFVTDELDKSAIVSA
jgi:hypothetical protein